MAGGMEVKKNVHVEEWGAYRENLEKAFRFNRRTIGYGLCFGIAVPLILYKGILAEFGFEMLYAISELRKAKLAEDLQLWKILSAKYQVVSGTIYYLKLLAGSEKNKKQYEAQVWVKPWEHNYMYLTDFKPTTSWDPSQA
ncbi:hypothetical protein O6H91_09G116800 [Diphasiastrum complanatum]|uniref:Uncharacterized protein n=1 Tax=Diphasiastrum complanatum TaxID=34168 RepID=A0ACC2CTZ5_DIPCM|nr:hypothetical protein O6H91_09G116800 [Diphasiastrum complanatum]